MRDLDRFLEEDIGDKGDITTRAVLGRSRLKAIARIHSREPIVVAGLLEAAAVFGRLGCKTTSRVHDGQRVPTGRTLLTVRGSAQSILTGERLALNLIGRMSGIATMTRRLVDQVRAVNPSCSVAATRKTTPGFRWYEKRAVMLGGGETHRFDLSTGILIKDNHLGLVPGAGEAVRRARAAGHRVPIEVEVSRWEDAKDALDAGADWLLLDNLSPAQAERIARRSRALRPGVRIEVSGGLTEENAVRYASFADRLSFGRLTHSAASADVTLDIRAEKR